MGTVAASDPRAAPYLLCDCAGTLDELPLGVAVGGAHLEGPRLLHQEDAAVAQVLHTSANLEADLWKQPKVEKDKHDGPSHRGPPYVESFLRPMGAWLGKFHCYSESVLGEVWNLVDLDSLFRL